MNHKKHIPSSYRNIILGPDPDFNNRGQLMEIEWVTCDAVEVFDYFISGFIPPDGKKIHSYNRFYDPVNARVAFKIRLDSIETPKAQA